jgi:lysine biosynthesis protein LysW
MIYNRSSVLPSIDGQRTAQEARGAGVLTEQTKTEKTVVGCLECGDRITVTSRLKVGQAVTCPECGTKLEIVNLDPLEIDWAYDEPQYKQEHEDW